MKRREEIYLANKVGVRLEGHARLPRPARVRVFGRMVDQAMAESADSPIRYASTAAAA